MDPTNFVPIIAGWLHMQPSALLADLIVISMLANAISRLIPNDATGWRGVVRSIAGFIGVNISSRVTKGVTIADTSAAVVATPVVAQNIPTPPEPKP